ncbi:Cyclic nucleotide-gated ion channel 17 [Linum grandiflorum]
MEWKKEKLVRFHPEGKQHRGGIPWGTNDAVYPEIPSSMASSSSLLMSGSVVMGTKGNKLPETSKLGRKSKVFSEDYQPWHMKMLDHGSEIVLRWNRIFLVSSLLALFIDLLYFYLPTIGGDGKTSCVSTDFKLRIVVTFFRTIADLFYLLHVVLKFRTAYVAPSSRVFRRGELVMDQKMIARRYIRSDFFIDLIAILPLP